MTVKKPERGLAMAMVKPNGTHGQQKLSKTRARAEEASPSRTKARTRQMASTLQGDEARPKKANTAGDLTLEGEKK